MLLDKNNQVKATFDDFGDLPTSLDLTVNKRITIDVNHPVISTSAPKDKYRIQAEEDKNTSFTLKDIVVFIAE